MLFILTTVAIVLLLGHIIKELYGSSIPQPLAWPYFKHYPYFYLNGDDIDTYAKLAKPFYKYGLFKVDILTVPEHVVLLDPDYPKQILSKPKMFRRSDLLNKACPFFSKSLLLAQGAEHKWQKKLLNRAFTTEKQAFYTTVMNKHACEMIEGLDMELKDGKKCIEVLSVFKKLAFSVIAESAFNYKSSEDKYDFPALCETLFVSSNSKISLFFNLFPFLKYIPFGFGRERKIAIEKAGKFIDEIITKRKNDIENNILTERSKNDFLSCIYLSKEDERKMTGEEIRDNIFTFCVGGFETTSVTLMWLTYAFAMNADIQEKVRKEIQTVIQKDEDINLDHINQLTYLDCCVKETLRFYNTSIRVGRVATADCTIGNYEIAKGQMIKTVFSLFHMNPKLYPDPERFLPERFLDNPEICKSGHWLAFGHGPYGCIGKRFALNEVKIAAAKLLLKFRFEVDEHNRHFTRSIRIAICATPDITIKMSKLKE